MPNRHHIRQSLAARTALLLVGLALVALVGQAHAQGGKPYKEPDFEKKMFVREAVLLETQEVASVVDALTALASNFPGSDEINHTLRGKALAIALRLDGTHPAAVSANSSLTKGELPEALADYSTLDEVAAQLWTVAGYLESPEKNKDERVLQFCLVDIARAIDPSNLAESNRYPTRLPSSIFTGWAPILGTGETTFVFPDGNPDGNPDGDPDKGDPEPSDEVSGDTPPVVPDNPTRTAQGAYRSIVAAGSTPSVARIRGDLKAGGGTAPLAIIFSDQTGDTSQALNDHRNSIISALTGLHGSWPQDGGVLVLAVDSENGADTGLLLPSTLLADALMRERQLHARTVSLGFVDPDGNLLAVDRLFQRLATFKSIDIDTILVPSANLPQLQDMALLGQLAPFFRFQFIVVDDLKDAATLAAATREEKFEKSLRDFKLVQEVAKDSVLEQMTGFTVVKSRLSDIIKLNPKHASASLLLAHGSEKLPKHLTRKGSLSALYRATGPVVTAMQTKGSAERATVIDAFDAVNKIQPILDPETAALGEMMSGLLKDIGTHAGMTPKTSPAANELKSKIFSTWETVRTEFARLKNSDG